MNGNGHAEVVPGNIGLVVKPGKATMLHFHDYLSGTRIDPIVCALSSDYAKALTRSPAAALIDHTTL